MAPRGRAKSKIEDETFNVPKNREFNFCDGKQHVVTAIASRSLMRIAVNTPCKTIEPSLA